MEFEKNVLNNTKLIAIGKDGIKYLEKINNKIKNTMTVETIDINQDVDKEYVRNLLDGVDILILLYNKQDLEILNMIKAISFMSNERRVMSLGIDLSDNNKKEELDLNREINLNEENEDKLIDFVNMMVESISNNCDVSIDLTDLKEIVCSDKGFLYTYNEFNEETNEEIVKSLLNNKIQIQEELNIKKGMILFEVNANYNDENMLIKVNDILSLIQDNVIDCEFIFSIFIKDDINNNLKISLAYN